MFAGDDMLRMSPGAWDFTAAAQRAGPIFLSP
jgi:hypothetical protein